MCSDCFLRREMIDVGPSDAQTAICFCSTARTSAVFLDRGKVLGIPSMLEIENAS